MKRDAAAGAIQGVPVEHLSAIRAGTLFLLLFYPFLSPKVLHKLQIIDHLFMVPDAVYHMDLGKIFQAFTGKVRALETPGYLFLFGASAETMPAVSAGGIDVIGKAAVAANFLNGNPVGLGHFL
jgi:hypothetical protein